MGQCLLDRRLAWGMELVLAGDAMLGRGVDAAVRREGRFRERAEAGPAVGLAALRPLTAGAEAVFANLECAITVRDLPYPGPPKRFLFQARPGCLRLLTEVGVRLVSLANNHALDAGPEGLLETMRELARAGIAAVGAGEDAAAAWAPRRLVLNGRTLGVLAACDHPPEFAAGPDRPGVAFLDLRRPGAAEPLVAAVRRAAESVEHLVVALHWQPNWVPTVAETTRALAARLIAAGARVVWGHSPHHLQGVEWFGDGVVLYGTGSLIDDYAVDPGFRNDRQLLYRLRLEPGRVAAVRAHPIELAYARSAPAGAGARRWIVARFAAVCAELGSEVRDEGAWLRVVPLGTV